MIAYRLDDVNGDLKQIFDFMSTNAMTGDIFPNTLSGLERTSKYAQNRLNEYVSGGVPLDGLDAIEKPFSPAKIKYSESKSLLRMDVNANSEELAKLQNGQQESWFDMKTKYPYGRKSRVSRNKDGSVRSFYLIIPFRWGTPNGHNTKRAHFNNFIPEAEYGTMAKPLKMSKKNPQNMYYEQNAKGQNILRMGYDWGSRLKNAWRKEAEGMVRMKDIKGSTYFTFRIISTKSPASSWWRYTAAKNPIDIQSAWARTVEPIFVSEIQRGILTDLDL